MMQSLHQRRLEDHAAQLARAAELQGESPQADRRGSRRRHARGAGHLGESARREQCALERGTALHRRARQRHRRERDGDRALLRLARTYLCGRRRGRAVGGRARHRAVVHHRGSDPPTLDRRDQRHAQRRQREHRDVLSGGSQSAGCVAGRGGSRRARAHHPRSESRCVRPPERRRAEPACRERVGHAERREDRKCAGIARTASSSTRRSR